MNVVLGIIIGCRGRSRGRTFHLPGRADHVAAEGVYGPRLCLDHAVGDRARAALRPVSGGSAESTRPELSHFVFARSLCGVQRLATEQAALVGRTATSTRRCASAPTTSGSATRRPRRLAPRLPAAASRTAQLGTGGRCLSGESAGEWPVLCCSCSSTVSADD